MTISNSTISGNSVTISGAGATASAFAGGIYNQQASLTISNSTVGNNTVSNTATPASAFHAGIRTLASTVAASTTITNSTISNNTANGEGGGVVNISGGASNSTTTITGSTISGNQATGATALGAGVENFTTSTGLGVVNLTNSTVSGNTTPGSGGGVYNSGTTATINLNYATVASNSGGTGGGLFQAATGTINLKNSIVADNTATTGPDISGVITSQDYNHVEDTSGGTFFARLAKSNPTFFALPNDVTGSDPQLGALGNNGGTTLTHLPASSSPVVNTIPNGTSDCGTTITTSQNALTRPQSTGCEKGAAELTPTSAGALVDGRLVTPTGRGLSNALVILTDAASGETRSVRSGSFGYFAFQDCPTGRFYILTVQSKQYVFDPQAVSVNQDVIGLIVTAR